MHLLGNFSPATMSPLDPTLYPAAWWQRRRGQDRAGSDRPALRRGQQLNAAVIAGKPRLHVIMPVDVDDRASEQRDVDRPVDYGEVECHQHHVLTNLLDDSGDFERAGEIFAPT